MQFTWQKTTLRVKDAQKSLAFYCDILGFTLIDILKFPNHSYDLYLLQSTNKPYNLTPGTEQAHKYAFSSEQVSLELKHVYGTEALPDFKYHPGNQEKDGFGHIAVACADLEKSCERLEAAGVVFKKKPHEGRMRRLAFIYDPDMYWIEVVFRDKDIEGTPEFTLAQTMLRVKDPKISIEFYRKHFGLTLVKESDHSNFSLYFMACIGDDIKKDMPDPKSEEASKFVRERLYPNFIPVLELTWNHGTESDPAFSYYTGNEKERKGYGHTGFLVDDVESACAQLMQDGVEFIGPVKEIAFVVDPDGYLVEILPRGSDGIVSEF